MGDYLTYKRNRAFDSDGAYPDENYAREVCFRNEPILAIIVISGIIIVGII